jgi:hypothetical protein
MSPMKRIAITVALLLAPVFIWGCGGGSDSSSSPATTQQGPAVVGSAPPQQHTSLDRSSRRPEGSGPGGASQDRRSSPKDDDSAEATRPPGQGSATEKERLVDKLVEKIASSGHVHRSPSRKEITQVLSQVTQQSGAEEGASAPEDSTGSSSDQGVIDRVLEQVHGEGP